MRGIFLPVLPDEISRFYEPRTTDFYVLVRSEIRPEFVRRTNLFPSGTTVVVVFVLFVVFVLLVRIGNFTCVVTNTLGEINAETGKKKNG